MKKKHQKINNIKCDICGYCNHRDFVKYSGVCHLCGKVLDPRAKFKADMVKKLRLWRNKKWKNWR